MNCHRFTSQTAFAHRYNFAISPRNPREFCRKRPALGNIRGRRESRVPNARAASRAKLNKAHERSHHRYTGVNPASPAQWFYGLLRALPGDQACLTPSPRATFARLDAGIGASEPHDLAVRISIIRPARIRSPDAAASTPSRSAFVTCARPSLGRTPEGLALICPGAKAED